MRFNVFAYLGTFIWVYLRTRVFVCICVFVDFFTCIWGSARLTVFGCFCLYLCIRRFITCIWGSARRPLFGCICVFVKYHLYLGQCHVMHGKEDISGSMRNM